MEEEFTHLDNQDEQDSFNDELGQLKLKTYPNQKLLSPLKIKKKIS